MMPDGGILRISLKGGIPDRRDARAGEVAEISISDTGPGIRPNDEPFIFDPFFTTKTAGTGLGLSVAFSIVESHKGIIRVENNDGGGADFRVRLPARQAVEP